MSGDWYERGIDLDGHLEEVVSFFESEREAYWMRNPENDFLRLADSSAANLLAGVEALLVPTQQPAELLDWGASQWLAGNEQFAVEVRERIQIAVARRYCASTAEMARRCLELAQEIHSVRPNQVVSRYLTRLSRCYILGLSAECVMICRAVLENAVTEAYDRHGEPFPSDRKGRQTMNARLDRACELSWLSAKATGFARDVWTRGNKAVHSDPEATRDTLGTVRMTLSVLGELYNA